MLWFSQYNLCVVSLKACFLIREKIFARKIKLIIGIWYLNIWFNIYRWITGFDQMKLQPILQIPKSHGRFLEHLYLQIYHKVGKFLNNPLFLYIFLKNEKNTFFNTRMFNQTFNLYGSWIYFKKFLRLLCFWNTVVYFTNKIIEFKTYE